MSEAIQVKRKIIKGIQYLIDKDNNLYDADTNEHIGLFDEETKTIVPIEDDEEEDDEEEDDEGPDENEGLYYLNKGPHYFNQTETIYKEDGLTISYHRSYFDTGFRINRPYFTEDIVKLDEYLSFGVPMLVETNCLARQASLSNWENERQFVFFNFIDKNNNIIVKRRMILRNYMGIFNPERNAFVAIFGEDKKHTTIETYNSKIVNAFRDYIIPKIFFEKPEYIPKYTPRPSKLPVLQKALEEETKNLETETDPLKQKVIKSLMKKLITEIPKAKKYDEDEQLRKERVTAEIEIIKQRNKELALRQKQMKKQYKDEEDARKIRLQEEIRKQNEERQLAEQKKKDYEERVRIVNEEIQQNKRKKVEPVATAVVEEGIQQKKPFQNKEEVIEPNIENDYRIAVKEMRDAKEKLAKAEQELKEATDNNIDIQISLKTNALSSAKKEWNRTARRVKEIQKIRKEKGGTGYTFEKSYNEVKAKVSNPKLYQQVKDAADIIYEKPSAYKSGFIIKKYKELGGTYSGEKPEKTGIARWFKEEWKDIGNKEYPVYRPTKKITKDTPLTPEEIKPSNLKKQIKLKQEIKGDANLPPFEKLGGKVVALGVQAEKIPKQDEVWKWSNPVKVAEMAKKYLGDMAVVFRSTKPKKKYMIFDPVNKKWVHFGEINYEDFTKHQDDKRRKNYLTRTANMKGNWKDNRYSANNLSRNILW